MSIAVLTQVYDEVRRLSIAGSSVAGGNFRLKKLVPPLEQAGQKAPVFAKVAQAADKLVEANEQNSAEALLELSTLVNAILYTQGETGLAGKLQPIETVDLGQQQVQASARMLKPLLEALSTTGSGRLEIIKDAHERGAFRDLRLVKPALGALDDPYPEIADFVAENVLPLYGKAILGELRAKFDQKGRAGHVRRLRLMHQLDPEGTRPIVKQALDDGSKEMKVVAIECLENSAEDLSFLLEQAKSKAKDVRQAALKALASINAPEATAALKSAVDGNDLELAVAPIQASQDSELRRFSLEQADAQLNSLLTSKTSDTKALAKQVERMLLLLETLRGRDDKGVEAFLLKRFGERPKIVAIKGDPSGKDLEKRLLSLMANGPLKAQQALVDAHETLAEDELQSAFAVACRILKPADVFQRFSPYLTTKVDEKKKKRDPAYAKREAIAGLLSSGLRWQAYYYHTRYETSDEIEQRLKALDPRWLDLAVQMEHQELVQALARPGHKGAEALLTKAFQEELAKSTDPYRCAALLRTMVRVQHPAATDSVVAVLQKHGKSVYQYGLYYIAHLIPSLPKEALPKLEAVLPQLSDKAIDVLLDPIAQLKNRTS